MAKQKKGVQDGHIDESCVGLLRDSLCFARILGRKRFFVCYRLIVCGNANRVRRFAPRVSAVLSIACFRRRGSIKPTGEKQWALARLQAGGLI
jgi:hypothetical protein